MKSLSYPRKLHSLLFIMTPLTPQTYHMIEKEELALMKSNAILINTARGGIVDGAALK